LREILAQSFWSRPASSAWMALSLIVLISMVGRSLVLRIQIMVTIVNI
jgi:hypothetical protein